MAARKRHFLYRIYDAAGRLIYIGATSNLQQRIREHQKTRPLLGQRSHPVLTIGIRMDTWCATEFPTRAEAFAAQRDAIRDEDPELNTFHRSEATR